MTCALQLANVIQKFQNILIPDNNACALRREAAVRVLV
jgi:hypothetical protein